MNRRTIVFWCIVVLGLAHCKKRTSSSEGNLKIDGGFFVFESGTYMPGVLPLIDEKKGRYCTGTAVSDTTLLTAAHCVALASKSYKFPFSSPVQKGAKVCIAYPDQTVLCTEDVYVPSAFLEQDESGKYFQHDVAVAVFPKGSFKYYHRVSDGEKLGVGNNVMMVGYSNYELFTADFPKRWGRNTVADFVRERWHSSDIYYSERGYNSGDNVSVSPGDSGGPLLDSECRVRGVASRLANQSNLKGGSYKYGMHTSLDLDFNRSFLQFVAKEHGATFCGKGDSCDLSQAVVPVKVDTPLKFPCKAAGEDTDPMLIAAIKDLEEKRAKAQVPAGTVVSCHPQRISALASTGGTCLSLSVVESSANDKVCGADYMFMNGKKFMDRATAEKFRNSSNLIKDFSDEAFDSLKNTLSSTPKWSENLLCDGNRQPGEDSCCTKKVCRSVPKTRGQARVGEVVPCPEIPSNTLQSVSEEALGLTQFAFPDRTETYVVPQLSDLESKVFPCAFITSLILRTTTGVCAELPLSNIGNATSREIGKVPSQKCFKVERQTVTGVEVACP